MQKKIVIMLLVGSVLVGAFAVYISFLPKIITVEVEEKSKSDSEKILHHLSYPKNWISWMVFMPEKIDTLKYTNIEKDKGAVVKWFSKEIGDGALEIIEVGPDKIRYKLISDNNQFREIGAISILPNEVGGTQLVWNDTLDISSSMSSRWMAERGLKKQLSEGNQKMLNQLIKNLDELEDHR